MNGVAMTSDMSKQRNDAITYLPYFSALGTVLPKSFKGAFSSKSREIYVSVIEILWDEVFETWTVLMFGRYLQKTKHF